MLYWKYLLRRVLTRTLAFIAIPLTWWYWPKTILFVIKMNTSTVNWLVQSGVSYAPEPWNHYGARILQAGEWISKGIAVTLRFVPVPYRDHVEVLVRLKYDFGAWMMFGELAAIFAIFFVIIRRRKRRIRIVRHTHDEHIEPTFEKSRRE